MRVKLWVGDRFWRLVHLMSFVARGFSETLICFEYHRSLDHIQNFVVTDFLWFTFVVHNKFLTTQNESC